MSDAERMECDVLIVGGGPAGLSAAIRLAQLSAERSLGLSIILLEKGSEIGAHILSGAVLEPRALDELLPDWRERGAPLDVPVVSDTFELLTARKAIRLPTPPQMRNHGNYVISLANFCRWLGKQAEALGIQIFPGFAAADVIIEEGHVRGIVTGVFGISKDGEKKANYQPGMELRARFTLFAEGCRGSLSQKLMETFSLRRDCQPQTYAIGIKELWEVAPEKHRPGEVVHTVGWPLKSDTYGGSFIYHLNDRQVALGFITALDYTNPYLDPYLEFQKWKTHPAIRPLLEGGRRLGYGARALNEGGWQSIPRLAFPGGTLIGDAAGFLNVTKIKGTHTAMKSGMVAAETLIDAWSAEGEIVSDYEPRLRGSWVADELKTSRNVRPGFRYGLWAGLALAAIDTYLLRGRAPWTMGYTPDHLHLKQARESIPPVYPKPDGIVTFARLDSVALTATHHEEDQPPHLKLKDTSVPIRLNLPLYDAPEQRYCPAGVYEIVADGEGERLQINAANCIHCKTCDIKDPQLNIVWTTPEGSGGPNYPNM